MTWAPDYVTATDVASYVGVGDTVDATYHALWATAASRAVDTACNRQFGQDAAPVARTYRRTPFYDRSTGMWLLEIDDVQTSTGLLVDGVAYASSGTTLLPDNAPANGRPWERLGFVSLPYDSFPGGPQSHVITARFGWAAFPAQVTAACLLQCNRWNSRRASPFGIAGSPDQGSEHRLLAKLDPDVATTLGSLRRRRRAG